MIEILVSIGALIVTIAAAFFAGKKRRSEEYEVDAHNEYIATRKRIEDATGGDLSDADVDDSLRGHAER